MTSFTSCPTLTQHLTRVPHFLSPCGPSTNKAIAPTQQLLPHLTPLLPPTQPLLPSTQHTHTHSSINQQPCRSSLSDCVSKTSRSEQLCIHMCTHTHTLPHTHTHTHIGEQWASAESS